MLSTVLLSVAAVTAVLILAGGAGLAVVLWARADEKLNLRPRKKGSSARQEPYLDVISARLASLEVKVEGMPSLWQEERERAKKQADRSAQAVRDLEARIAEGEDERDPDDDVLADDAGSGYQSFVSPLPNTLEAEPGDDVKARAAQALALFGGR